ncbi:pirin family protein [Legionella israelensis]|uniref:pirin family protein n=1 Tax=Legionella israelensis TaxID=454 RepID=UPI00117FD511|nr:pirin family protein [Legionella israelensis]QDP72188.1 pirin family protein [Legionella israelensis]
MKSITKIIKPLSQHWVGNGFPVKSIFSYHQQAEQLSPFLLLDYAEPRHFPADGLKRGVGKHPHRGFETVTIVYQGELEHRDSTGQGGNIAAGDVQWMTAGSGILHEEFHSKSFGQVGGTLQMVQLWVNLPKKDKMTTPSYQAIKKNDIPVINLPDNAGSLRPIAGEFEGVEGAARTFTPMNVWDINLNAGGQCEINPPEGWTCAIVVLSGKVFVNRSGQIHESTMVLLSREQSTIKINAKEKSLLLHLSGEPIREPIVGRGPFVLNDMEEILQAYDDLRQGRFGNL